MKGEAMKRLKSPINLILTVLASIPLFIFTLKLRIIPVIPTVTVLVLLFFQFIFNKARITDLMDEEMEDRREKAIVDKILNEPISLQLMNVRGSPGMMLFLTQNVRGSIIYKGAYLTWLTVLCGYIAMAISVHDKITPYGTPFDIAPFIHFFMGLAVIILADMAGNILVRKNKIRLAYSVLFGWAACGLICLFTRAFGYGLTTTAIGGSMILTPIIAYFFVFDKLL